MTDHVIICGLGQIGFRSFELLHRAGRSIVVITDKAPDDWLRAVTESGGLVLIGDARNDALLIQAGIASAASILAVTDQDLVNVSVVMDARRLNPAIRIVCRLFDTDLGAHISNALGINQVFSASELAAPMFVGAALQSAAFARARHGELSLSFEEAGPGHVPDGASVIAAVDPDGQLQSAAEADPTRVTTLCVRRVGGERHTRRSAVLVPGIFGWAFLPSMMNFRRALLFVLCVVAASAAVIRAGMNLSWIDAFYFVMTTVTTVGYGDFNFAAASPGMKVFGIALMMFGTASLALLVSTLADALLSERFSSLFGGRNVPRRDHVVVTGAAHIGIRVVEQLTDQGIPVVVIENDRAGRFAVDLKRKVAVVEGDGRNVETLGRANAGTARALLAMSDDDVENLSVGLSGQSLNRNILAVVRMFDAGLASRLQSKLSGRILSVSSIAAPYFAAAALADRVIAAVRWQDYLIVLSEGRSEGRALGSVRVDGSDKALQVSAIRLTH